MKTVLHIGPANTPGGMASVIQVLSSNPPDGWRAEIIQTSGGTLISKFLRWVSAKSELKKYIVHDKVQIVHIHVTHSLSWWRKRSLMRTCEKYGIPTLIHIHSGKFEKFCSGIAGTSVTRELAKKNRKTIILENRWKGILSKWLPNNVEVVNNCSFPIGNRNNHKTGKEISLLLLSRKSKIKGHEFAIKILERLVGRGHEVKLIMTGITNIEVSKEYSEMIETLGWVETEDKAELVERADFLISPSEFEGSSMSVIEAMVSGLPCIVSAASSETVVSEKFVIESNNPEDWAERIIDLYGRDEYFKAVEETIENSRLYHVDLCVDKFGRIYEDMLGSNYGN